MWEKHFATFKFYCNNLSLEYLWFGMCPFYSLWAGSIWF